MHSRHVTVTQVGSAETMELRTTDLSPPAAGHAIVRVQAAGVSFGDILLRHGVIPGSPTPPFVSGFDVAGVVEQVGKGVTTVAVGQPVAALVRTGGYSDRLSVPVDRLVVRPEGAEAVESAAVALNYFIAHQMLHRVARVAPGDRILVHGASGGVGTAFLQLARLAGVECYGTASSARLHQVSENDAHPIDYRNQDFVDVIRALPGASVSAVFDPIGGRHFHRSYSVLRKGGMLVAYGQSAALVDGKPNKLEGARGFLGGIIAPKLVPDGRRTIFYNAWSLEKSHPDAYQQDLRTVLALLAEGKVSPVIAKTVPLSEAAQAQQWLEEGTANGKLVLTPGE